MLYAGYIESRKKGRSDYTTASQRQSNILPAVL